QHLKDGIEEFFADPSLGGYVPGGYDSGDGEGSAHYGGRALDIFYRPVSEDNKRKGWVMAHWLIAHAPSYEIEVIIFDDKIWSTFCPSLGWRYYHADPDNEILRHLDHVHVYVTRGGELDQRGCLPCPHAVAENRAARFSATACVRPRGSALQTKTHFQAHLEMGDLALLDVASDLGHLEPVEAAQGARCASDTVADRLIDPFLGSTDDLRDAIGVSGHPCPLAWYVSGRADATPRELLPRNPPPPHGPVHPVRWKSPSSAGLGPTLSPSPVFLDRGKRAEPPRTRGTTWYKPVSNEPGSEPGNLFRWDSPETTSYLTLDVHPGSAVYIGL